MQLMDCYYKHQNQNSKFAHLQESHHSIRPTEDIMEVMQVVGKENFMNVLEKFHIYKETYTNSQTIKLRWDTIHSSQL